METNTPTITIDPGTTLWIEVWEGGAGMTWQQIVAREMEMARRRALLRSTK